ncbi:hypothetical protein [Roseomonas xinghualingensis]|uniref:hypothetical protein n=1 Tax=Roseomonas xinghualingensis TaxID=2986475 RepID=UPI0021F10473|nr:hypothetical protein [Roseomonas sp. SXEYE001]MCV4206888.1 hypothetical protein [Roseomonas sp. SXEYE001]
MTDADMLPPEGLSFIPPSLYRLALEAFSSPALSADAMLVLADMADQAARDVRPHHTVRGAFEALRDMLRAAAPVHADKPLPSSSEAALPVDALLAAARILDGHASAEVRSVAKILRLWAAAQGNGA